VYIQEDYLLSRAVDDKWFPAESCRAIVDEDALVLEHNTVSFKANQY